MVKIIKMLDNNTSIGIDDVPNKLIILASHVISGPLSDLINPTLTGESIFPMVENAACLTPAFEKTGKLYTDQCSERFLKSLGTIPQ